MSAASPGRRLSRPSGAFQVRSSFELADSHVHLDRYGPAQQTRMLARARRAGVRHLLTVGVDLDTSFAATDLARRRRGVLAAVGVHPTRLHQVHSAAALAGLRGLLERCRVAALGEVGLDVEAAAPLGRQEDFFAACLDLAEEHALPVVLHVVGAHERALRLLAVRRRLDAVVHYFQGDQALAQAYLALGCQISVGKPVTRADRSALRQAVAGLPLESLLLETDTYPLPGRTTEPRDVLSICQAVAELHGVPSATVARTTLQTYQRLFTPPNSGVQQGKG